MADGLSTASTRCDNAGAAWQAATAVKLTARTGGVDRATSSVALELTARGVGSHSIQYRVFDASLPIRSAASI